MNIKFIAFFLLGILLAFHAESQMSEGGTPPSFKYPELLKSGKFRFSGITLPVNLDLDELYKEDLLNNEIGAPPRLAVSIPVHTDIFEYAEHIQLPDGTNIRQFTIEAPDALGINFRYEKFFIPAGGRLFIYNSDKTQILGAYTHDTNPGGSVFSTQIIGGSEFIFEYVEAPGNAEQPSIYIQDAGYIYKRDQETSGDMENNFIRGLTSSLTACMINVNCPEGDGWQDQKRGIVWVYIPVSRGWLMCTGSLVNNTENDGTPYVLSAYHCFNDAAYGPGDYGTTQFYFNYEHPNCTGSDFTRSAALIGSEKKVELPLSGSTDGVLLLMKNSVPTEWNPYFNGWDATGEVSNRGVVIHHPNGEAKKISTYTQPATSATWVSSSTIRGATDGHWRIFYASTVSGKSVTAGGSSGAPLFNQEGLIIGTLSGGQSYCESYRPGESYYPDLYGKFWYHYNQSPDASLRMKQYLDPKNTGVQKLAAYEPAKGNYIIREKLQPGVVVFPTVFETEININAEGILEQVDIYDAYGQIRYSAKNLKSSTVAIQAGNWENGIYLIKIKTENGNFTEKIVKR